MLFALGYPSNSFVIFSLHFHFVQMGTKSDRFRLLYFDVYCYRIRIFCSQSYVLIQKHPQNTNIPSEKDKIVMLIFHIDDILSVLADPFTSFTGAKKAITLNTNVI